MPIVDRELRDSVATEFSMPLYRTWLEKTARHRMKNLLRRTLFIALSDGARIDVFRRWQAWYRMNKLSRP